AQNMKLHQPEAVFSLRISVEGFVQEADRLFQVSLFVEGDKAQPLETVSGQSAFIAGAEERLLETGHSFVGPVIGQKHPPQLIVNPAKILVFRELLENLPVGSFSLDGVLTISKTNACQ